MRKAACGLAAAVLVLAAGGGAVGQDGKIDGKLIVGKWKEAGKDDPTTIEFTKDGKLIVLADFGGKELKLEGTYKLDGNKLAVKLELFGKEDSKTMTVNSLTAKEMVTTDEKGKKETLVRVGDKK